MFKCFDFIIYLSPYSDNDQAYISYLIVFSLCIKFFQFSYISNLLYNASLPSYKLCRVMGKNDCDISS